MVFDDQFSCLDDEISVWRLNYAKITSKWPKMTRIDQKWPELTKIDQNWPNRKSIIKKLPRRFFNFVMISLTAFILWEYVSSGRKLPEYKNNWAPQVWKTRSTFWKVVSFDSLGSPDQEIDKNTTKSPIGVTFHLCVWYLRAALIHNNIIKNHNKS